MNSVLKRWMPPKGYVPFWQKLQVAMENGRAWPATWVPWEEDGVPTGIRQPPPSVWSNVLRFPAGVPMTDQHDGTHMEHPGGAGTIR